MGKIRKALRTAGILAIILGLIALFIPVVGFFVGLPMLFIGLVIFSKTKEEKLKIEKNIQGSFLKLKPIVKSKNYLVMLIALSFAFFVFGPRALRSLSAGLIILLFILYSIAKHEEYKQSGKKPMLHFSDKQRKMAIVLASFFSAIGFFWLFIVAIFIDHMWKESSAFERILFIPFASFYAFPGALIVILSFWGVRYAYRSTGSSNKFTVIEPGQAVISKEGIISKDRTLKEKLGN